MSCSLKVKITNGSKLVGEFYANLFIRDLVQQDNEVFGWTNGDEYVTSDGDKSYLQVTTTIDNISAVCEKYKGIYLSNNEQLTTLKISRLSAKTKVAYEGLSEDIFNAIKEVNESLEEWTSILIFYHSIILLADNKNIIDYSALKVHMYLG